MGTSVTTKSLTAAGTTTSTHPPTAAGYKCHAGRGAWGQAYTSTSDNSLAACSAQCNEDPLCAAMDFTTFAVTDACRLYEDRASEARLSDLIGDRQYCRKA